MQKKSALVRNGRHMRPMLAVLERYGIGEADKYGRGRWIKPADLAAIKEHMLNDKSLIQKGESLFVKGTCIHNYVSFADFNKVFAEA